MKKIYAVIAILLALPACHVNAKCHWQVKTDYYSGRYFSRDYLDILFVVNNASDKWMYLWMGHPGHGEDNGNLNLKPHSSATALGCSNGNGYAVTGIILTQGKDVLYTFDVDAPHFSSGLVKMHIWKGGCYVAWGSTLYLEKDIPVRWDMLKMAPEQKWNDTTARVRIDCV